MRLIISLHAAKAGGTSFGRYLLDHATSQTPIFFNYGTGHPLHGLHWQGNVTHRDIAVGDPSFDQIIESQQDQATVIVHGHLRTDMFRPYPGLNPEWITWLRDPIERIRSHFDYWRLGPKRENAKRQDLRDAVQDGTCSLAQFGTHETVANYYQWILGEVDVGDLAAIGILEQPEESLMRLTSFLGLSTVGEMPNLNQTEGRTNRSPLAPETHATIAAANEADIEIYRQAVARY